MEAEVRPVRPRAAIAPFAGQRRRPGGDCPAAAPWLRLCPIGQEAPGVEPDEKGRALQTRREIVLERRLLIQTGEQAAGLPRQYFFDDLAGLADDEERAGLAEGQLHFLRRRFGQEVVGGRWCRSGRAEVFRRERSSDVIIKVANSVSRIFSVFSVFPASIHFFLTARQVGGQLRGMVPGVKKKNRGVMFLRVGGMVHRNDRRK